MTAKITVDPGAHEVRVTASNEKGEFTEVHEVKPGEIRSFHVYPGRALRIEEIEATATVEHVEEQAAPAEPQGALKLDGDI